MSDPNLWGRRPEVHTTPELYGVRCDCCEHLSCIEQPGARIHRWMYYCDALRRRFKLKELYAITRDECPAHREIRRRFR